MAALPQFRRVVLGLHHNAPRHGLQLAAEVAALLRVELCGLFVKEDELAGLAALPFAREFRPLEGAWHTIDFDELKRELDLAADSAQRSFAKAAKALGLSCRFEVIRGSMAATIASVTRAGDIVALSEPAGPAERVSLRSTSIVKAALGSAAAVMFMPEHLARSAGAVVAVAGTADDPSIAAAAAIAALAKEDAVIIDVLEGVGQLVTGAGRAVIGGPIRHLPVVAPGLRDPVGIAHTFHALHERLVVMTRGVFDDSVAAMVASARRVPVLLIEPETNEHVGRPGSPPAS